MKTMREYRNIEIEDFASKLNVSPAFIKHVERGDRGLLTHKLYKAANILGVKMDNFFQKIDIDAINKSEKEYKIKSNIEFFNEIENTHSRLFVAINNLDADNLNFLTQMAEKLKN